MKSAEEIIKDYKRNPQRPTFVGLIGQVQKDAYKQGVWDALENKNKEK